jgi:hypothetical protein
MILYRISIFFCLVFVSCASNKASIKLPSNAELKIDPVTREKAKGSGSIKLLEHQLLPIDYLHKHPDVKGLLINHYMGTGKTYAGIGFAQSYEERPVIILAPKFLESHWMNQIRLYGVKNPERFMFVSYKDAPEKLTDLDVSEYILLADEVHNLIKHMRTIDPESNAKYIAVYTNLRKAYKILGLTGTPIYGDESDFAFLANFVSGQNLLPFNQETFRLEFTKILPARQFFRGYLTESNFVVSSLPFALGIFCAAILGPVGFFIGAPAGVFLPVAINTVFNTDTFKFRELDVKKMRPFMNKYVSYFRFDESKFIDFPALDFSIREVSYNPMQYSLFFRLVEGDLPVDQLQRLLQNEVIKRDDEFVQINSTNIHEQIYSTVGAGRDIGNFDFTDQDGNIIEAPKFLKILSELKKNNEQTVVYSNYYETGILAFQEFLKRNAYTEPFAIIRPDLSVKEVNDIVSRYNQGDIRLLLLHPDITEGISLKGTQYLHILEPMLNSTVLEQVIGRTRRFQSHAHLSKEKQKVHVRMWQSTSSAWNLTLSNIKRANWYKRYRELAYMSRWGVGIAQIDKKMDSKALNPEELALLKLRTVEKNLKEMQKLLINESIELNYK